MVGMNLLNITITNARAETHPHQGSFVKNGKDGDSQGELRINKTPGHYKMNHTPGKLELNTGEVLDSVRAWKWDTIMKEERDKGKQAALEATARIAHEAIDYRNPFVNGITQDSKNKVLEDGQKWYGLGWTPSVQAHAEYTPWKDELDVTRDEYDIDVEKGSSPFTYQPSKVDFNFLQRQRVDVEYTGDYNRFPTGKHIDTKA